MVTSLPRPPVVAILGHVDHGKTSLLDFIRKSRLAQDEHGAITQKIGAYEISTQIKGYKNDKITFIDTPGHEAFSQLRLRGANVADLALLIIDAKDSVMPQTIESISHIQAAKIPFIVVINKIDLPEAKPEKVKNDLLKHKVLVEGKGGQTPVVNVSAKTGQGVSELLEAILLISSDLNLAYQKNSPLKAVVIETKKDRRGVITSAIVKDGLLKIGQTIYVDSLKTKVRSLTDDLGRAVGEAYPSTPVEILGFDTGPAVGSLISGEPQNIPSQKTVVTHQKKVFDLATILAPEKKEKKLRLIIKTDTYGSLEAITSALSTKENIESILSTVGDIHKSDIFLAKTSKAVIVGFNSRVDTEIKQLAKQEKVIIKTYQIIFELLKELDEVTDLLKLKEEAEKAVKGQAKILATFEIEKEKIYGMKIVKGKFSLNDGIEVYRENNPVGKTKVVSLKIRAKRVDEVKKDQEAGMIFSPPLDIRVGDVVKSIL